MKPIYFERAVFISWYCSKRDCAFCYLSSKKNVKPNPKKDRRTKESILAEVFLCKLLKWKIEFLSGGCESYTDKEILNLLKRVKDVYGKKVWLNIGPLTKKQLMLFKPYIEGVCGAVECINPKLRKKLCPSKPLKEIIDMFKACDELKLKKAMTIIAGLGESLKDIQLLNRFIKKHKIDRLTFYRLKPQKGTIFEKTKGPEKEYYIKWVKGVRKEFPKLELVAGSWLTHLDEIHLLLEAGADSITKFPSTSLFNSDYARKIEDECRKANRRLISKLSGKLSLEKSRFSRVMLNKKVKSKLKEYIRKMGC